MNRFRRTGTLFIAAAAMLAFGTIMGHAAPTTTDTDDHYNPASTTVVGKATPVLSSSQCGGHTPPAGTVTCFAIPGGTSTPIIVVFCTTSTAGGKTPASGLGAFPINPLPKFSDSGGPCTDSLHGTDTTVTKNTSSKWTIGFIDAASDETKAEPNSTGDQLVVSVPKGGAVVTTSEGCTITVAPSAAFKVVGAYDDHSKFTVHITNLPVTTTGGSCPLPLSTVSTFNAVYSFTPGVSDAS